MIWFELKTGVFHFVIVVGLDVERQESILYKPSFDLIPLFFGFFITTERNSNIGVKLNFFRFFHEHSFAIAFLHLVAGQIAIPYVMKHFIMINIAQALLGDYSLILIT